MHGAVDRIKVQNCIRLQGHRNTSRNIVNKKQNTKLRQQVFSETIENKLKIKYSFDLKVLFKIANNIVEL